MAIKDVGTNWENGNQLKDAETW